MPLLIIMLAKLIRQFNIDITKQIPLQNTIIVLKKIWKTDVNGDMFNFMKEVDKLNQSGRLDKKVLYLG